MLRVVPLKTSSTAARSAAVMSGSHIGIVITTLLHLEAEPAHRVHKARAFHLGAAVAGHARVLPVRTAHAHRPPTEPARRHEVLLRVVAQVRARRAARGRERLDLAKSPLV